MIHNHLIIGLGGSGGKIIREMRKSIERHKDELSRLAAGVHFDFLYIDTSEDEDAKKSEWSVLGKPVELERSQFILNKAGDIRPVLDDPDAYPGLASWVQPSRVFSFVNATTAGAAQKRKLGRVIFAQNATKFVDVLQQRVRSLETQTGLQGVTVHVVCGLAGGTGSGSVVDTIAQVRKLYPNPDRYRILAYCILPERNASPAKTKGSATHSNYYANAYAALSELNAMAVGKYHPVDVLTGNPLSHDLYFNGCYLVNDTNEHGVVFNIDQTLPRVIADFIYQKAVNSEWEGLGRAEKGENDVKNFETDESIGKARAKLFLSFGLERVVVPDEEIKEFMAYSFAEQATRQLMFNNYRQGEGFADEPVYKDWRSEVRKPEVLQSLLLTNEHLVLETGILEDDAKNSTWKSFREYWKQITARLIPDIQNDKNLEQSAWLSTAHTRLSKVYDETFRMQGGVGKFFETKGKARPDMARRIALVVEKELFTNWRTGRWSLIQLRQFMDALVEYLDERANLLNDSIAKAPAEVQKLNDRINELTTRFNGVGFLGKHLTDKRESLFAEITDLYRDLFITLTTLEGQRFAVNLLPLLREELVNLRSRISSVNNKLMEATEKVAQERAEQLGAEEVLGQQRVFDREAIDDAVRMITLDEQRQMDRTQTVRNAIIQLAGKDTDTFVKLAQSGAVSVDNFVATLSQESVRIVEAAHAELAKSLKAPVLNLNIVERLAQKYDGNQVALKDFVKKLFDDSGCTLRFRQSEIDKMVEGHTAGQSGRLQTIGVFLPECETTKEFRQALAEQFERQKTPGADTQVMTGKFDNQIIVMKVSSLMPARFVDGLEFYKQHYDALLKDEMESVLMHSVGNGSTLPSLYARTAQEIKAGRLNKPNLMLARLLNQIKQRENRTTGLQEWVFVQMDQDLPKVTVLQGRDWRDVLNGDHSPEFWASVRSEVGKKLASDYVHIDRKREIESEFRKMIRERFDAVGQDDQDPDYQMMSAMLEPLRRDLLGIH